MGPRRIIAHIDAWLNEHGWRLDDRGIDFALDVRRLVDQLGENDRGPEPVWTREDFRLPNLPARGR